MIDVKAKEIAAARRDYAEFLKWYHGELTVSLVNGEPVVERYDNPRIGSRTRKLFDLLGSCDLVSKRKLAQVFPAEVYVYLEYVGELDPYRFNIIE
ncbi:hypothetical protein NS115_03775 [Paenibacillus jamilae]|uniref:Uncharacterized protein n=2 Tax=Paenibacillus jamilae TaxID=114136 RepID=A0ACC5A0S8_9BACL|nr:hypothetical protein NS115_03775 [Paenibacillus jamilae]